MVVYCLCTPNKGTNMQNVVTREDLIKGSMARTGKDREAVEFMADLLIILKAGKAREDREDHTPVQRYYITPDCMGLGSDD